MKHKFKKGQLVSYKFRNNAGKTEKGLGHILGRRSRYYLIKPNLGTEVVKVYCNQTFEIAVPPTDTVVNETPEKDVLDEKKSTFDTARIVGHIFALGERMYNYFCYTIAAITIAAAVVILVLK